MRNKILYSFFKNYLKKPIYLIFFVTNKCNSRCKHCFFSKELNKLREKDLSLEEIEDFSKQIGKLIWVSLSGGEPFLREDITEIFEIFVKNNKVEDFSIPTNGISSDKIYEKTREMLEYAKNTSVKVFSLSLSLDGTKEMHDKIRGVKCYDEVIKTYKRLVKLKDEYKFFNIRIATTLSNVNINNIENLHKEVIKKMPRIDYHNFEILRGEPRNKSYKEPTIEDLNRVRPLLMRIYNRYNYYSNNRFASRIAFNTKKFLYDTYLKILQSNRQPFSCYAGIVHCVLGYQGDIFFCELLGRIGNIRKNSFKEIWDSEKAKKMRLFIKKRKCTCTHTCFQTTNFIFNQRHWLWLLKNCALS